VSSDPSPHLCQRRPKRAAQAALAHACRHRPIPKSIEQEAANAVAWYAQRATENKLTYWHAGITMERDPATGTYRYRLDVVG
jgi:hypothetical protein